MADSSFARDTTIEQTIQEHSKRGESEALIAPIHPKSLRFQLLYGAANLVIGIGNITFYTLLLPARIAMLASSQTQAEQTSTFVLISLVGALASILTNPIVGALRGWTKILAILCSKAICYIKGIIERIVHLQEQKIGSSQANDYPSARRDLHL